MVREGKGGEGGREGREGEREREGRRKGTGVGDEEEGKGSDYVSVPFTM